MRCLGFLDGRNASVQATSRHVSPTPAKALNLHGKEGVSGSSPEEGSLKAPQIGVFPFGLACAKPICAVGMEPFRIGAREPLAVLKVRADDTQEVGDANDCTLDLLVTGRGGHPVEPDR